MLRYLLEQCRRAHPPAMPAMLRFQDRRRFQNSQKPQATCFKIKFKTRLPFPTTVIARSRAAGISGTPVHSHFRSTGGLTHKNGQRRAFQPVWRAALMENAPILDTRDSSAVSNADHCRSVALKANRVAKRFNPSQEPIPGRAVDSWLAAGGLPGVCRDSAAV